MTAILEQIEIEEDEWRGCYKQPWSGLIVPEAFAHPAKYSRALIRRIYDHVIEEGWVEQYSTVIDPFGGVALGALDAMLHDLNWTGCELEAKFYALGNQNIALWNDRYSRMPQWGKARLLNGDSRKLASIIRDAWIAVSSPPYVEAPGHGGGDWTINSAKGIHPPSYGESEGQLGAMKEGDHAIAITSPPYNPPMSQDHNGSRGGSRGTTPSEKGAFVKYGNSDGQLEGMSMEGHALAISSPPFSEPQTRDRAPVQDGSVSGFMTRAYTVHRQGVTEGNLAALPPKDFDAAISSPPYEGIRQDGAGIAKEGGGFGAYTDEPVDHWHTQRDQNNLGNLKTGETFWSASRVILEQLHQVLAPNAHAVFVVKAFVRNKQIVDFPAQWAQLCEAVGFRLIHHHKALLTEDYGTQTTFHGEDKTLTIARKSFFRRLAESKGSPKIDWESVLCFEKHSR